MKYIVLLSLILIEICAGLRATLTLLTYNPLIFSLNFTQNVILPNFQILVDNKNLQYQIISNQTISNSFQILITSDIYSIDTQYTESFSLVFNYPLNIQNGTLFIGQYILSPQKCNFYLQTSSWPALFIFLILACSSIQGLVGNFVIDFMQIYILTQLKFKHTTSFIQQLSKIFFFNQNDFFINQLYLVGLFLPSIIIISTFLFGLLIKTTSRHIIKNPIINKKIIKFMSYDLFFTVWFIMLPSALFSALDFIYDINKQSIQLSNQEYIIGIIITYLNFLNILIFLYFIYFILNPKLFDGKQKFRSYLLSEQFKYYIKFHNGLHLLDWTKRNIVFFVSIRKFIIIILFFYIPDISSYVLTSQFIVLFFLFTIRPYKQQFYTYVSIVFTLIYFFFFIIVLEGYLYFSMQQSTLQTNYSMQNYLIMKTVLFLVICFVGFLLAVYENYIIIKNIKYQIKQQQQNNKNYTPEINHNRNRLLTETSDKQNYQMKQSLIYDNNNDDSPLDKKKTRQLYLSNISLNKGKLSLFQIQMDQLSSPIRKRKTIINRSNQIWKDKSLFEQLATTNN